MTKRLRAHPTKWQLRHGPRAWMVMCRFGAFFTPMGMGDGQWGHGLYSALGAIRGARPARAVAVFHTYEAARLMVLRTLKQARLYFRKDPRESWPDWIDECNWGIVPMRWENPHK